MLTEDQLYATWKTELETENKNYQRDLEFLEDEKFEVGTKRRILQNVRRINAENGYAEINPRISVLFDEDTMNTRYEQINSASHQEKVNEISEKIAVNKIVIEYLNRLT